MAEGVASAISEFVGKEDYDISDVAGKVEELFLSSVINAIKQ